MAEHASSSPDHATRIEWMWKSNPDPWSETQTSAWSYYSDVENIIIERAFSNQQPRAILDGYCIDFKHWMQIADNDPNKQRSVRRIVCNRDDQRLREERFMPDPIAPKRPFGGQYGWVSPFIIEVRKSLNLRRNQSPSKDKTIVPMIVEKAASGIIEEGTMLGIRREGEEMAAQLIIQQNKGIIEVWECCAYLYSLESFLYKKVNEAMRLIGGEEHDTIWRSKVRTWGPFCLLLWDNPFNNRLTKNIQLYRSALLTQEQIAAYQDLSKRPYEYRSFQAFTSCSRNRKRAERFRKSTVLFIMDVESAFSVDISPVSKHPEEEEELVAPGVCFNVLSVKLDARTDKHLIHLRLRQRFNRKYNALFRACFVTNSILRYFSDQILDVDSSFPNIKTLLLANSIRSFQRDPCQDQSVKQDGVQGGISATSYFTYFEVRDFFRRTSTVLHFTSIYFTVLHSGLDCSWKTCVSFFSAFRIMCP